MLRTFDFREMSFTLKDFFDREKRGLGVNFEFFDREDYNFDLLTNEDKSKFIEYILIGMPIPNIFFTQKINGQFIIISHLYFTRTIKEFLDGNLTLIGLDLLPEYNGYNFESLNARDKTDFYDTRFEVTRFKPIEFKEKRDLIFKLVDMTPFVLETKV